MAAIEQLDFILREPGPAAKIESVGDSNIVIWFGAWVNQRQTDFGRGRSLAIRAAKDALEDNGFTLPEPIYRVRFDETAATIGLGTGSISEAPVARKRAVEVDDEILDTRPDEHLERMVSEEREQDGVADLLDQSEPVE